MYNTRRARLTGIWISVILPALLWGCDAEQVVTPSELLPLESSTETGHVDLPDGSIIDYTEVTTSNNRTSASSGTTIHVCEDTPYSWEDAGNVDRDLKKNITYSGYGANELHAHITARFGSQFIQKEGTATKYPREEIQRRQNGREYRVDGTGQRQDHTQARGWFNVGPAFNYSYTYWEWTWEHDEVECRHDQGRSS